MAFSERTRKVDSPELDTIETYDLDDMNHRLNSNGPMASIVIVTRNRCNELLRVVGSCLQQDLPSLEVLVFDDASDDETTATLEATFPDVKVTKSKKKSSPVKLRNLGFERAASDIVFSLDDDCFLSDVTIVREILNQFSDSSTAVIGIPFIQPNWPYNHSRCNAVAGEKIASFTGCAAAFRKSAFIKAGGFRECFEYYGEERDLSIRLLALGYELRMGRSKPAVHTKSLVRDTGRQSFLAIRNTILFDTFNIPFPWVIGRLLWDAVASIRYRFSFTSVPNKLTAVLAGYCMSISELSQRRPVSNDIYAKYRRLPRHGALAWPGPVPEPCGRVSKTRRCD